ncbi:MAG TPA: hypothetical protein VND99_03075 [Candidatus Acidoferrales bacterium]|nr:hypothetical protein [Candidatus Acidoferrales bacterium]
MVLSFSVLLGLLELIVTLSLFWTLIGFPVGIILIILKFFNKFKVNRKKILWGCFGGIVFFVAAVVLFVLISAFQEYLGIPYQDNKILLHQNLINN